MLEPVAFAVHVQQVHVIGQPVEGSLKVLADYIGPNKIMWATDYPHSDGFFPGAPDMVRERLKGTSPATQRGVLAGGALSFYGMN